MKISAVYARVALTEKPDWLEPFRTEFHYPYDYHITLKQGVVITDDQLPDLQQRLRAVLASNTIPDHRIRLVFDTVVSEKEDGCIMLMAQPNQAIADLQRSIVSALKEYNQHYEPQTAAYEADFHPHITIAHDLGSRFDNAVASLGEDVTCVGDVTEIVLSCVSAITPEEANNPANLTVFKL